MARGPRGGPRPGGSGPGPLAHRAAHRPGAPLRRLPPLLRQHRLREHHPGRAAAAAPGRLRARAAHPPLHPVERHGARPPRQPEHQRRRPHRQLRLGGDALRRRLQPLLARRHQGPGRRPGLHPGPLGAGDLRPRLPARAPLRGPARPLPAGGGRQGDLLLPAPLAHAEVLELPHRVDGARPPHGHLPGPVHEVPGRPRPREDRGAQGLGAHRRRGDGRAGVHGRDRHGRAGEARQPRLRGERQPPAARRAGARQRQDHPGAGERVPRRRLERHQGDLGTPLGSPARPRQDRRAAAPDDGGGRRRLPDLQVQERGLRPRALLQHPRAQGDGGRLLRRGHLEPQPGRARSRSRSSRPTRRPCSTAASPPSSWPRP